MQRQEKRVTVYDVTIKRLSCILFLLSKRFRYVDTALKCHNPEKYFLHTKV